MKTSGQLAKIEKSKATDDEIRLTLNEVMRELNRLGLEEPAIHGARSTPDDKLKMGVLRGRHDMEYHEEVIWYFPYQAENISPTYLQAPYHQNSFVIFDLATLRAKGYLMEDYVIKTSSLPLKDTQFVYRIAHPRCGRPNSYSAAAFITFLAIILITEVMAN